MLLGKVLLPGAGEPFCCSICTVCSAGATAAAAQILYNGIFL